MSSFKPRVRFPLNFASPFSEWHIIPMKFSNWNIICFGQKRAHQSTIFQIFKCSNESSPNSSCHFWNRKVRVYSNFTSLFNVMKDNPSVFLCLKPSVVRTKRAHQKEIFRLLSGWMKIQQIPHVIFETTRLLFFKLCITLPCYER